jgi:Queuosine salvage protein
MIVLETTKTVMERASHVSIDEKAIGRWARETPTKDWMSSDRALLRELPGDRSQIANLVLLISALNFCFWSDRPIEIQWRGESYRGFVAMLVSLILSAKHDLRWADPAFWCSVPDGELRAVLSGGGDLLLMDERIAIVRETGHALIERFDGEFTNAIESVNERAWPLAVLLMTNFEGFRDVSSYKNTAIYFLKRAQICALDLHCAWAARDFGCLAQLETLSAFADYRIPQALRHLGLIALSDELAARIDSREEIARDSEVEIELRAASIQAVNLMAKELDRASRAAHPWQIDCWLWESSHASDVRVDHHRTRTICY